MSIKKIWKSLDFRGNKILDAVVNTPTLEKGIAPKDYVDNSTKLDTTKANQFPDGSPKFSWMDFDLKNKTFKELFDNLFFPIIKPIYTEPTFNMVKVVALNEYGNNLIVGRNTKFNIKYDISVGDRISTVIPKLRVTTKSPVTVTEYNGNTTANSGNFDVTFDLTNIDKIELVKQFDAVFVVKNDNYGTPYLPAQFTSSYELVYDVFGNINSNYVLFPPIVYKKLDSDTTDASTFINEINDSDFLSDPIANSLSTFVRDRKLFLSGDSNNVFIIGVPSPLFKNHVLCANINETPTPLVSRHDIPYPMTNNRALKTLIYGNKVIDYLFFSLHFGYHLGTKEVNFSVRNFENLDVEPPFDTYETYVPYNSNNNNESR